MDVILIQWFLSFSIIKKFDSNRDKYTNQFIKPNAGEICIFFNNDYVIKNKFP